MLRTRVADFATCFERRGRVLTGGDGSRRRPRCFPFYCLVACRHPTVAAPRRSNLSLSRGAWPAPRFATSTRRRRLQVGHRTHPRPDVSRVLPAAAAAADRQRQSCRVRYRAWQPATRAAPTFRPLAAPVDIVDTWGGDAGRCRYHVMHPAASLDRSGNSFEAREAAVAFSRLDHP